MRSRFLTLGLNGLVAACLVLTLAGCGGKQEKGENKFKDVPRSATEPANPVKGAP